MTVASVESSLDVVCSRGVKISADVLVKDCMEKKWDLIALVSVLLYPYKKNSLLHISNPHQREEFRHHSYVTLVATGLIAGLGVRGYLYAIDSLAHILTDD